MTVNPQSQGRDLLVKIAMTRNNIKERVWRDQTYLKMTSKKTEIESSSKEGSLVSSTTKSSSLSKAKKKGKEERDNWNQRISLVFWSRKE